ncbi:MAG TPA: maltose alpha-D-glucosyltransferase [Longimicrobiales bacterium]|nr:maltose alpha-D-glucosyltransferase [Longimicrobiales bacterium]
MATRITGNPSRRRADSTFADDPLWYKDAVIYQAHVRAFYDSNGDGMGDFRGLTQKLDYLQDLGVTALWLLPFYPSPWRDDGYDIADYSDIHPAYGTMTDFKRFLREAHGRGLRVITELVINHTSDQHPWFQKARRAKPGSAARDFYVWTDDPDKYRETRIIFKDFESSNWSWDPVAKQYFWHRFYSHQPDLNFDNPAVHDALFKLMDYWFNMGVDGMRLDAIPYLYEREGTNCENLPETHEFLKKMRAHLDANHRNRLFLAEANQWPEETVPYFGDGDECHMAFHFPVMPRLFMSIQMEDRFPIIDILKQTPPIPENCQWATFLRNHDELTLEMVTDEERDYMYRMYAADPQARINLGIRRRLAPLLQGNRRKIELMNSLLFSLPGTPTLYYGDEIGMGDNIYLGDRNGVRTPMQWSADRNAGFSRANPQRLYLPVIVDPGYHYETVNVEAQQANPSSLYWWTKRLIALRKRFQAFGRGTIEFLYPDNRKVLAFLREYEDETILVVANTSRFAQYARLDLSRFRDHVPVELFGLTEFPRITSEPFLLTLGPHSFYWFEIRRDARSITVAQPGTPERTGARVPNRAWQDLVNAGDGSGIDAVLPAWITGQRWFQGKGRAVRGMRVSDVIPTTTPASGERTVLVEVQYVEEQTETYVLPLTRLDGPDAQQLLDEQPHAIVAHIDDEDGVVSVIADATHTESFRTALLEDIHGRRRIRSRLGELQGNASGRLRRLWSDLDDRRSRLLGVEQSNTSLVFGRDIVVKLYRRLEDGESLDLEVGRFLADHGYDSTPQVLGSLDYRAGDGPSRTLAVVQEFVSNEGDAWELTLDAVGEFYERAATFTDDATAVDAGTRALLRMAEEGPDEAARALVGPYLEEARLLGLRTGEMHVVLASDADDPAFAPEEFTLFYQRSLYQSMRNLAGRVLQQLEGRIEVLPDAAQELARELLTQESAVLDRFRTIVDEKINASRIRCHGDLHLGQVLFTGNDFYITDFEGEPIRPLSERRLKRSPLRDVAGMLRSFHYAAHAALMEQEERSHLLEGDRLELERWARRWYTHASAAFLNGYLDVMQSSRVLPRDRGELARMLDAYLLEKAVYELGYELGNRPAWAAIPLHGILQLLAGDGQGSDTR